MLKVARVFPKKGKRRWLTNVLQRQSRLRDKFNMQ